MARHADSSPRAAPARISLNTAELTPPLPADPIPGRNISGRGGVRPSVMAAGHNRGPAAAESRRAPRTAGGPRVGGKGSGEAYAEVAQFLLPLVVDEVEGHPLARAQEPEHSRLHRLCVHGVLDLAVVADELPGARDRVVGLDRRLG